jgi:hypothetical protein
MTRLLAALLIGWLLSASGAVHADSWAAPTQEVYRSDNARWRLTVTPREIGSPLAYFEEQGDTGGRARGALERLDDNGRWTTVWDGPLLNDVAPVSALVANSGRYVVTFDDWHFVGTREHVVVIYDADGAPIRSLSLADLLPDYYIEALPRSVSSINWGGDHRISEPGDTLILSIIVPAEGSRSRYDHVNLSVNLSDGVLQSNDPAWRHALTQARRVAELRRAAAEAAERRFRAPLLAPAGADEGEWHGYLIEAFFRLEGEGYPGVKVLRAPSARDYGRSQQSLCEEFSEDGTLTRVVMIASPSSPENLVRVLRECVARAEAGVLNAARIYVAVPLAFRDRAIAALAPTGARVIYLDPTVPIPQRPERLERRGR